MSHYTLGEDAARFGVVSFNHLATLRVNFSHNAAEIDAGIDEMTASGSTSISSGFLMTRQLFADHARVNATKIVLLLSDGQDGGAVAAAALVKGDNVTVFAWGFGGANLVQLEQLASDPSKAVLGTDLSDLTSYLAPLQAAVCALPPPSLPPSPPSPPPPCRYLWDGQLDDKTDQKHCPPPPPSPPPPSPPTSTPCTSFDGVVWSDEFTKWVGALFQMADADGSGTVNDRDELAMLLSFLNLEPSEDCADKLNQLLKQSLNFRPQGISFKDFYFKWLKDCLPARHVWRDCPPSAPPSPPPPCGKYLTASGELTWSYNCPPPSAPSKSPARPPR